MSMTSFRGLRAPAWTYSAIWPGPGRPARSGSRPDWMPVDRMLLMSRVPVYWTLAPVWSSHGFTIAMNDSCSVPVHVPMTETEPPSSPPADADADALSPAPALAGGALAGVDPSGLALEPALEQATAINMTAISEPATFVRRTIRSSMPCLLSRRPVCPGVDHRAFRRRPRTCAGRSGPRRRSRRGPDDELGREQRPGRDLAIRDPFQECASGGVPELVGRQPDRGEGWVEIGGKRDVVEADDRDVVGNPSTGLAQGADGAEGDDVAGHEGRIEGGPGQQLGHRRVAAGGIESALGHQLRRGVEAGRLQGEAVAVEAVLGGGVDQRSVGDAGDPAVAERDQVLHRATRPRDVVDVDTWRIDVWQRALQDDREPVADQLREEGVVHARAGYHEAVGVLGAEQ